MSQTTRATSQASLPKAAKSIKQYPLPSSKSALSSLLITTNLNSLQLFSRVPRFIVGPSSSPAINPARSNIQLHLVDQQAWKRASARKGSRIVLSCLIRRDLWISGKVVRVESSLYSRSVIGYREKEGGDG